MKQSYVGMSLGPICIADQGQGVQCDSRRVRELYREPRQSVFQQNMPGARQHPLKSNISKWHQLSEELKVFVNTCSLSCEPNLCCIYGSFKE